MEAASLTNRDLIWSYAIAEWERNPLFGYGPGLFGLEYRTLIGIPKAFHAHNQVMQSLGSGGWFGVIGLLLYMGVLAYYAIRAARPTRGLSLALLLFILLRSITEVPLRVDGLMNGEFFVHLLLMMVVLRPARDVDRQGRAMGEEWRSRIRASI